MADPDDVSPASSGATVAQTLPAADAHPAIKDLEGLSKFIIAVYTIVVGLLAAVPVLLDLAGALELDSLWHFKSRAVIALTSTGVVFWFFYMFSARDRYKTLDSRDGIRRKARNSMTLGSACFIGFLVASAALDENTYDYWVGRVRNPDLTIDEFAYVGDVTLSLLYFFALTMIAQAFTYLTLLEYFDSSNNKLSPAEHE